MVVLVLVVTTGYKEQLLMSVDNVDVDDDGWAWYKGQVQMDVYDDVDDDERTCYKGEVLVDVVDDDNYDDVGDDVDDGAADGDAALRQRSRSAGGAPVTQQYVALRV